MAHGDGQITVEMDDYDWYNENAVTVGDQVTVSGRVDKDFFEKKEIEASTVYLPKQNEYFYASAIDEEMGNSYPITEFDWNRTIPGAEWVAVTGTVEKVEGDTITVDLGLRDIVVDASGIKTAPITDTIQVGDHVSITGEMKDMDLFAEKTLKASSVVVLTHDLTAS